MALGCSRATGALARPGADRCAVQASGQAMAADREQPPYSFIHCFFPTPAALVGVGSLPSADAMKRSDPAVAVRALKRYRQALNPGDLWRRWQALDNRALLTLLAALLALYLMVLSLLTQPADEAINALLLMGGALLVFPELPEGWQPRPGRIGRWLAVASLVVVFWRGQRMVSFDAVSSLLLPLAGLALGLLAVPVNQLRRFGLPLIVLGFLPVMRALGGGLTPIGPLTVATAWLSEQFLAVCGFTAMQEGPFLRLPGGGVEVAGPCSGLNMLLQLLVVAVIFALAFPMRHRWQNGLMIVTAPLIAMLTNAMRIALLAWINASAMSNKTWWFEFFHTHWGSLVFAGIAMQVFVWLYVYWLARQVAALGSR